MNPVYDFTGQVALVTGASWGIGLTSAQMFAEAGAAIVLVDINEGALRAATEALTAAGHQAIGVTCDVADETQTAQMVERTVAVYGRLDMAFKNAVTEQVRVANRALVDLLVAIAERNGATAAQVALAWLLAQHSWIVPIPGTTKGHRLQENNSAAHLELTPCDLDEITSAADRVAVQGDRYPAHIQRMINR